MTPQSRTVAKRVRFEALVIACSCLTSACESSQISPDNDGHELASNALYRAYPLWPNGTVPVCWGDVPTDPSAFKSIAARVRLRTNTEWPTAAGITFTGWKRCRTFGEGEVALNIVNFPPSGASPGFNGNNFHHEVNLYISNENFDGSLIPHELGHLLGFAHEFIRPDFDTSHSCDGHNLEGGDTLGTPPDFNSIMASAGYCQNLPHLSPIDRQGALAAYGSSPNHFAGSTQWTLWSTSYDHQFADVTGDGRADLIGRSGTNIHVGPSTGSGFASSTQWATWNTAFDHQFADGDGDGLVDLIGRSGDLIRVARSNGTGFSNWVSWTTWNTSFDHHFVDVDADGAVDIVGRSGTSVHVSISGSPSTQWTTWEAGYDHNFADVNGDGRADIIGRNGTLIHAGLSTGSSFAPSTLWTTWDVAYDHQFADVNGDGRADLIGRSGDNVQVALSTGSSFATSTLWTTWSTLYDHKFEDPDGDGRADILGRSGSEIHVGLASN